jgi:hypothetical protein
VSADSLTKFDDGLARRQTGENVSHQVTDEICFPNITALLTANGHSLDKAAEIVLFARHKQAPARQWIKVLARADAARDRYQRALGLPFPLVG